MPLNEVSLSGFLLSRHWDELPAPARGVAARQLSCHYWLASERGPLHIIFPQQTAIFFIEAQNEPLLREVLTACGELRGSDWYLRPLELQSFARHDVLGVYFYQQRHLFVARERLRAAGLQPLEADINPSDRFLMERFITAGMRLHGTLVPRPGYWEMVAPRLEAVDHVPTLRVVSLDIETSMDAQHLFSIAVTLNIFHGEGDHSSVDDAAAEEKVWLLRPGGASCENHFDNERQLLQAFLQWFLESDPDVIIGWNVINFDLRVLQARAEALKMVFPLGRGGAQQQWRSARDQEDYFILSIPGRAVLDGIETLKSATYNFESFALDSVANALLQRGKQIDDVDHRGEEIARMFRDDPAALARYNLEDCRLVWDIFQHTQLLAFALARARMTGLAVDRFGGSVAAFDHRYLPRLHRLGLVAPALQENPPGVGSPGGYVMASQPGVYRHVLVLDFKSLYPSIIRSFLIDPAALALTDSVLVNDGEETQGVDLANEVPGFNGARFKRDASLLPALIDELWQQREQAKRQGNTALSQAIKILMNSFYGVLGTPGCRFFDSRLPSSITLRGHEILTSTRALIEAKGHTVIYGDTDSLFVWVKRCDADPPRGELFALGEQLAADLNAWWAERLHQRYQLDSALELEFETCFGDFVMPTVRGAETGSKKRYAGKKLHPTDAAQDSLVFKGLEAVRSDWCALARDFQRELYRRVFAREPYAEWVRATVKDIYAGRCDVQLLLRKRIRRPLHEYQKNVPPHVQAARRAEAWRAAKALPPRYARGGWIEYYFTLAGAEARECVSAPLDYSLYVERQIRPVVDSLVHFLGTSFDEILGQQLGLF